MSLKMNYVDTNIFLIEQCEIKEFKYMSALVIKREYYSREIKLEFNRERK